MKRTTLAATVALAALFSANTQASTQTYTETGSDGMGDSFSITYQYDNVADVVIGATAGSFTDASGSYAGVDILFLEQQITPGVNGYGFINLTNDGIIEIALSATAIPEAVPVTSGIYAATFDSLWQTTYFDQPATVPEPSSLAALSIGFMGLVAATGRRKQA